MIENDVLLGRIVPDSENPYWRSCSGARSGVNALRALSDSSWKLKSVVPRSGPMPGIVMMSMCMMPVMPPWFWAANMSMRGRRIDRICDFGGRRPPVNPSTRMTDPGGDIALSTASISSGSSGSASICSRVSTELKALPFASSEADWRSRLTVRPSSTRWIRSVTRRLASLPPRTRTSLTTAVSKPGNSTSTV